MTALHLERASTDLANAPVPPNISFFLDRGIRDAWRWYFPLVLELRPTATLDDVRAVLTAVTSHHDALRLTVVERAGMWEQRIAPPQEFTQLSTRVLPPEAGASDDAELDAIRAMLADAVSGNDLGRLPVTAVLVVDRRGVARHLAIAVHFLACDDQSRDIVSSDLDTALRQRVAGEQITLPPATLPWVDWSQRFTSLATHPDVVGSREFWLDNTVSATLRLVDHEIDHRPRASDLERLSAPMSRVLTAELHEAHRSLELPIEDILLAALGRSIARTFGEGVASVDLAGHAQPALLSDMDLQRTVGHFTPVYPLPIPCVSARRASATAMLGAVHTARRAVPEGGIGYGLLRYVFAGTALQLAIKAPSDVFFSYLGTVPAVEGAGSQADAAMSVRDARPGLGHALELRAYRVGDTMRLDWWYDTRRLARSTVDDLTEQFPLALIELTSEAAFPLHESAEIAMACETFAMACR